MDSATGLGQRVSIQGRTYHDATSSSRGGAGLVCQYGSGPETLASGRNKEAGMPYEATGRGTGLFQPLAAAGLEA